MSSRPQPTQKQAFLQQIMLAVAVFLGFQMFCNRPAGPPDPRTSAQVLGDIENPAKGEPPPPPKVQGATYDLTKGSMYWANAKLNYLTISSINSIYQNKLRVEEEANVKKAAPADRKAAQASSDQRLEVEKLRGDILIADTAYKYGKAW